MHHVAASVTVMMFIPISNIDHESNNCESVGVTSVEGADALLERPIEYRAEWEDASFFYAYLNDIIVSDTFRFRSRSILYSVVAQYMLMMIHFEKE